MLAFEAKEPPKKLAVDLGGGVKMEMTLIPAGEFLMGNKESAEETAAYFNETYCSGYSMVEAYKDEHPQHRVRITKPFYLGICHVTRGQFRQFVADTGYKTDLEKDDGTDHSAWRLGLMAGTQTSRGSASTRSTPGGTRDSSRPTGTPW